MAQAERLALNLEVPAIADRCAPEVAVGCDLAAAIEAVQMLQPLAAGLKLLEQRLEGGADAAQRCRALLVQFAFERAEPVADVPRPHAPFSHAGRGKLPPADDPIRDEEPVTDSRSDLLRRPAPPLRKIAAEEHFNSLAPARA